MQMALDEAGIAATESATSTPTAPRRPLGDAAETRAIKRVLGEEAAYELPVSSTKSMTGPHARRLRGDGGGDHGARHVPRRASADDQPGGRPIPSAISTTSRTSRARAEYRYALSNGFGFGGHNASLVFARWDEHDGRREPEKVNL